ncbi:hypothetical protein U6B65_03600 [Oscillospiraceae bacterium MB08-C2-2]|nr:hypothetical protein U6B65_03600 [Oscillospiraceae bacterium MB08-C2-2]
MHFEQMNDHYKSKHYPKGSVFARLNTENKKSSVILLVMLVLFAAALGAVLIWEIALTAGYAGEGNSESVKIGIILLSITGFFFLLCILGIVFSVKNFRKGVGEIIEKAMISTGLSEEELKEFDRQAMEPSSYILRFKSKLAAAVAEQQNGILTKDYLWLGNTANEIMKCQDIVGVCFYQWSFYVNKRKIWCRSISVLNRQGTAASAEASEENGLAFIELLTAAYPHIHIEKKLLSEGKEYDDWRSSLLSQV